MTGKQAKRLQDASQKARPESKGSRTAFREAERRWKSRLVPLDPNVDAFNSDHVSWDEYDCGVSSSGERVQAVHLQGKYSARAITFEAIPGQSR